MADLKPLIFAGYVGAGLLSLGALWIGVAYLTGRHFVEQPKYIVRKQLPTGVQIREYPEMMLMSVDAAQDAALQDPKNERQVIGRNFRRLAGFIFGDNVSRSKVAMTAPVMMTSSASASSSLLGSSSGKGEKVAMTAPVMMQSTTQEAGVLNRMSFVVPSKYLHAEEALPVPRDSGIEFTTVPSHLEAVMRWPGTNVMRPSSSNLAEQEARLRQLVEQAGYVPKEGAPVKVMGYDPPWTPPFMRLVELALEVQEAAAPSSSEAH